MTGREVSRYINTMWSSGKGIGTGQNFGMGVKIASITRNPLGIEYYTWKDGIGYFATLWYDKNIDDYGMKLIEDENGGMVEWIEGIDNKFMPDIIEKNGGNGTKLVFLGRSEQEDTFRNEDAPMPSRCVSYDLNNRYYRTPENIKIQARRLEKGRMPSNKLVPVTGLENLLSRRSKNRGTMELKDAKLHWMLLKDVRENHHFTDFDAGAQSAVVFDDEIYDKQNKMGHRSRMASKFGLLFSYNRVAIFIEPTINGLDTDMVRKNLVMPNHQEGLPWIRWGREFKEDMPAPIRDLESELNDKAQRGNDLEIQNRIMDFLKNNPLPRFESNNTGDIEADIPDSKSHKDGASGSGDQGPADNSEKNLERRITPITLSQRARGRPRKSLRKPPPINIQWIQGADEPEIQNI